MAFSKLRGKMAELGMTQGDMAKALGISRVAFSQKINGKREFTLSELKVMALVLNLEHVEAYFFA